MILTIMPKTGLTVLFESGEQIERIEVSDLSALDIRVSDELDSFLMLPQVDPLEGRLMVYTSRRTYPMRLRSGTTDYTAYLVRYEYPNEAAEGPNDVSELAPRGHWSYAIRGDNSVRPAGIWDDGNRTYINYRSEQPLPAVFAIGASGEEEVVNGYMRGERFVIDRIYPELVFRIDKERARARRNNEPDILDE